MKKKIALCVAIFLGAFIVGVIAFMPFGAIASKYIIQTASKNNIDLRFDTLNIGFFGAEMTNIKTGNMVVDNVALKYNPVGLIFKRFSFNAKSPFFIADGKMAGDEVTADIRGSVASIAGLAKCTGSGSVNVKGKYNLATKEGSVDLSSGAITFAHPLMNVEADSLNGNAGIKGNLITVSNLSAKGKTSLEGKGTVVLNTKKIEFSTLDLEGKAGMMGMDLNFKVQGAAYSPRFITQ